MLHTDRNIDIVVYGATGFTGKLVCQHLQKRYLDPSRERTELAIGGRSQEKLDKVKSELGLPKDLRVFVADSHDEKAYKRCAKKLNRSCLSSVPVFQYPLNSTLDMITDRRICMIIFPKVGPYALYGDKLVEACVANGTHYFDLTGETLWASRQISKLETQARESKAMIVHSCGYDSVPERLECDACCQRAQKVAGENVKVGRVTSGAKAKGGVSGGTIASMLNMYDEGVSQLRRAMSCYLLSPVKGHQKKDPSWVTRESGLVGGFFIMAPHNGAIVRRSWGLLEASSDPAVISERYGAKFSYDEYMTRKSGWFKHITTAHSVEDDVQVRVTMSGNSDPGYGWTAISIAECAMTCVRAHNKLPALAQQGGFLTPATALGDALLERLEATGTTTIEKQVITQ
ncbi:hypothetical protein KEM48_003166 [Puccinia striiformis f. sp. tritici PST-130]|nr:hypothetical protein KEM48_003166 [Puccinia striiformis f. sp. tritici PST-130]